jgi:hypothetical protein
MRGSRVFTKVLAMSCRRMSRGRSQGFVLPLPSITTSADGTDTMQSSIDICKAAGYELSDTALAYITGGTSTPTARATSTPDPTSAPSPTADKKSGLSTGAIIGISIGAAFVIMLAAIGAFCCIRHKKNRPPPAALPADYPPKPAVMQHSQPMMAPKQDYHYAPVSPPLVPVYSPPPQQPYAPPPHEQVYAQQPQYGMSFAAAASPGAYEMAGSNDGWGRR